MHSLVRRNGQRTYMPGTLPPGNPRAFVSSWTKLTALQTDQINFTLSAPFLLWAINGFSSDAAGILVQLTHQSANGSKRLFSKHLMAANAAGSAQRRLLLDTPRLFEPHDALAIEVKNLSTSAVSPYIEIACFGTEPYPAPDFDAARHAQGLDAIREGNNG